MQRLTFSLRQRGLKAWRGVEGGVDAVFGSALNPLRHLGAIGFLAFWLLAASGVVLFIFFDLKSRREEFWMRQKLANYGNYQARVRKLIPFIY